MPVDNLKPLPEAERERLNGITEQIIGSAYRVAAQLGPGFLEKVYKNALLLVLKKLGMQAEPEAKVEVFFDGVVVGLYYADLLVENAVVVEVKAVRALDDAHYAQLRNYLIATDKKLGLLLNFGTPSVQVKRVVNKF